MSKHKNPSKEQSKREKEKSKSGGQRFTVDDPQNDIFDDELYDDESPVKIPKTDDEKFERPW